MKPGHQPQVAGALAVGHNHIAAPQARWTPGAAMPYKDRNRGRSAEPKATTGWRRACIQATVNPRDQARNRIWESIEEDICEDELA